MPVWIEKGKGGGEGVVSGVYVYVLSFGGGCGVGITFFCGANTFKGGGGTHGLRSKRTGTHIAHSTTTYMLPTTPPTTHVPAPISPAPSTATVLTGCAGLPCLLCFSAVVPMERL